MDKQDRTASLMTPARLAQLRPAASSTPAAWLDRMAADAGSQHVLRSRDLLRSLLDLQAPAMRDACRTRIEQLAQSLPQLDFGLLQARGWLERLSGRGRGANTGFLADCDRIEDALAGLTPAYREAARAQRQVSADCERLLVELEVEFRAIDRIVDQGARWLHDMRRQLKSRESPACDEPSRALIEQHAARCELLLARLKTLRALVTALQQVHAHARIGLGRSAEWLGHVAQGLAGPVADWRLNVPPAGEAAAQGHRPPPTLEAAMTAHRELQLWVKQAAAGCAELQQRDKSLADSLSLALVHLQASGAR